MNVARLLALRIGRLYATPHPQSEDSAVGRIESINNLTDSIGNLTRNLRTTFRLKLKNKKNFTLEEAMKTEREVEL
jgi:C4-dicarboxylate-specific signal transduction histidine kinase